MMGRMSTRDLAEKYGKSKNSRQLVNAAVRAELAGGAEALDALEAAHKALGRGNDPTLGRLHASIRAITEAMQAEIRRRYGMPDPDADGSSA